MGFLMVSVYRRDTASSPEGGDGRTGVSPLRTGGCRRKGRKQMDYPPSIYRRFWTQPLRVLCELRGKQVLPILLSAAIVLSCGGKKFRLLREPDHLRHNWLQFRRTPQGVGHAPWGVDPPVYPRWKYKVRSAVASSPLLFGDLVVFGALDGTVHFLDGKTGKRLGEYKVSGSICGTPLLSGGMLVVPASGGKCALTAFDLTTGEVRWRRCPGELSSSPVAAGDRLFLTAHGGTAMALDLRTGEEIWRFETEDPICSSPALSGEALFFGCDDDHLYALSAQTGELLWKTRADASVRAAPAVCGKEIYFGTTAGTFYRVGAEDGKAIWTFPAEGGIYAAPVCGEDRIYFGSDDRHLYALNLKSGDLVWKFKTQGVIKSTPALTDRTIYFGSTDRYFYALDARSGELKEKHRVKGPIQAPSAVGPSAVYIGSIGGLLYAFGP